MDVDIYGEAVGALKTSGVITQWPAMQSILERAAVKRPRDWQLPVISCEAVGGTVAQALPAVAAVACLQISIILIDDLLDEDPRGEQHRIGLPAAANLAAAFQALGLSMLTHEWPNRAVLPHTLLLKTVEVLSQMALCTAWGQQLDVLNPVDEAAYWYVVRNKSGPFYAAALQAGALCGGAAPELARQIGALGQAYGEMIQIHDDLNDSLVVPASPDWTLGRASLPILFAQTVGHSERARFQALCQEVSDPAALAQAQTILIRSGAFSYAIDQLLRRHAAAQKLLSALPLARPDGLAALLERLAEPVRALFQAAGIPVRHPGLLDGFQVGAA